MAFIFVQTGLHTIYEGWDGRTSNRWAGCSQGVRVGGPIGVTRPVQRCNLQNQKQTSQLPELLPIHPSLRKYYIQLRSLVIRDLLMLD